MRFSTKVAPNFVFKAVVRHGTTKINNDRHLFFQHRKVLKRFYTFHI